MRGPAIRRPGARSWVLWLMTVGAVASPVRREAWAQEPVPRAVLAGHQDEILEVRFSPDGTLLATAGCRDATLRLWDVKTGKEREVFKQAGDVDHLDFSPDGWHVAYSVYEHRGRGRRHEHRSAVCILDVKGGQSEEILSTEDITFCLRYAPDGQVLAISAAGLSGQIHLWDVGRRQFLAALANGPIGTLPFSNDVAFSRDGAAMATNLGGEVDVWDTATWRRRAALQGHTRMVNALAFSPDGKFLASGSSDNTVRIWDLTTKALAQGFKGFHGAIDAVAFSPDGKLLAAGSRDKTLTLWETATDRELVKFRAHDNVVRSVAFSPDGTLLATGGRDRLAKVWVVSELVRRPERR